MESTAWKRCNACKQPIAFGQPYWVCNVSTCNRKRTALSFCSVSCWEVHLPIANHREAWAEERRAPSQAEHRAEQARSASAAKPPGRSSPGRPKAARSEPPRPTPTTIRRPGRSAGVAEDEILIVASRLKDYIRHRSGFNTSDRVLRVLSDAVRRECDAAIDHARRAERQTVLDRDLPRR